LASGSATRARLLRAAGVSFTAKAPDLDEAALRAGIADAAEAAQHLADSKALVLSDDIPGAWVIGSDQILALGVEMLGKPGTREGARAQLRQLQGVTHALVTAVTLAREGHIVWQHVEQADLTMRVLTKHEIDRYLDRAGSGVLSSPGAYHLEGLGATLFETVRGDYFSILGLPLLPLLGALRQYGALVE
jgi:septum formation protein